MSIIDGAKSVTVGEFNGTKPLIDLVDISPGDAQVSLNCVYSPGQVKTRTGFTPAWTTGGSASCPHYWAYGDSTNPVTHYLTWLDLTNSKITTRDLTTGTPTDIKTGLAGSPVAASFTSDGKHLFASVTAFSGGATLLGGGYVWDGNTAHSMDATFQRPMKTTEMSIALTEPSAGSVTAGAHYVGVLFQTRAGYWTRPGPVNASLVLQPATITSAGAKNINVALTPATTWPSWIVAAQVILTTTLNSFQYYVVPGTITTITAGSATVINIAVDVSDINLRSVGSQGAGTLADEYFDLLSMDASNAAPFNVKFQVAWGNRVVWFGNYGGIDTFFPSDPENPEWITANQHAKTLPNNLPIGSAFVLNGVLYVISSSGGVYGYTDDGGRPVNFQPPRIVDEKISCQSVHCVTVAASGGRAFVLADQGLYPFTGTTFPDIPMSYFQSPDFVTYGSNVSVLCFEQDQLVIVQGYGSGGTASLYTFHYEQSGLYASGMTPDKLKTSPWTFIGFPSNHPAMESVRNPITNQWELYVSRNGGGMYRQKSLRSGDVALYTDYIFDPDPNFIYGIDWQYQCSPLPPGAIGELYNQIAVRVRAKQVQATLTPSAISKAAAAVLAFTGNHGLALATTLTVTISGATGTGWTGINATWTPTVTDQTHFSVPFNSTGAGTLGGTIVVTINGKLSIAAKNLDDTISVTPAVSPIALSASPGQRYLAPYDMQGENVSYLFTNGAIAGNGVLVSEFTHFYTPFAEER